MPKSGTYPKFIPRVKDGNLRALSPTVRTKKRKSSLRTDCFCLCRRRPIFPGSYPPSIFGTIELNYRVRDGNGWDLNVIDTDYMCANTYILYLKSRSFRFVVGDPYGIRTHVAGVRGRSLRPLDQRATNGTPSGTRTLDTLIKSQVLYQLS